MTALTRRQMVLLASLAVVAVVVLVAQLGGDNPAETGGGPSNRAGQGDAAALPDAPVVDLGLDRLHKERGELPESERNPFRFRPKAPPPPPPRSATSPLPAPRPPEFTPPPVPAGPPPLPPIPLKFFGVVELRGQRVAAFADARGNTFHGKEGDIIEGRYRVLQVSTDSVELAYLDGRGRQTIRLTGQ
jgi:hypothetical protein